ncbi:polysaccharide deacetylase family protein [Nonomuraea ferruginea]
MRSTSFQARIIGLANVVVVVTAIIGLLLISGEPAPPPSALPQRATPAPTAPTTAATEATPPPGIVATPELAREVKANELGKIPVIMYHRIVKKRQASIDRTPPPSSGRSWTSSPGRGTCRSAPGSSPPATSGCRPGSSPSCSPSATGTPATSGSTSTATSNPTRPWRSSWRRRPDIPTSGPWPRSGSTTRRSACGPSRSRPRPCAGWLGNGFEVANHTWGHPNLRAVPTRTVRKQLAKLERLLVRLGAGPAKTMALPYGSMPRKKKAARSGAWEGTRYAFDGVFLAGAEPSLSPYAKKIRSWRDPADPEQRQEGRMPQVVLAALAGVAGQASP